jgi:hypothetical protein
MPADIERALQGRWGHASLLIAQRRNSGGAKLRSKLSEVLGDPRPAVKQQRYLAVTETLGLEHAAGHNHLESRGTRINLHHGRDYITAHVPGGGASRRRIRRVVPTPVKRVGSRTRDAEAFLHDSGR